MWLEDRGVEGTDPIGPPGDGRGLRFYFNGEGAIRGLFLSPQVLDGLLSHLL